MSVETCQSTINIVLYQRSLLFKKSKKTFSIISNDKIELLIINHDSQNNFVVTLRSPEASVSRSYPKATYYMVESVELSEYS